MEPTIVISKHSYYSSNQIIIIGAAFVVSPKTKLADDEAYFSNIVSVDILTKNGGKITQFPDEPIKLVFAPKKVKMVNRHFVNKSVIT